MRRFALVWVGCLGFVAAAAGPLAAQELLSVPTTGQSAAPVVGGTLHGVVKSGAVALPGVTVTVQNSLTGKRYSTTTDLAGAWSLTLPQNGRWVLRTQFAAFAPVVKEARLDAQTHDLEVNFALELASRASVSEPSGEAAGENASVRPLAAGGVQGLTLQNTQDEGTEQQNPASTQTGAALPSIAGNSDFATDSVAVSGQAGTVSAMAGMDMDRMRDSMETMRAQTGFGGGLFGGGGPGGFGGGFGGPGGFGPGGGGRGNFRSFNSGQPHGAFFWAGSNSALNAQPFALNGQTQNQPSSGSNRFGITFMSAPYIPGKTKPSGKDTIFFSLSGTRESAPSDQYAIVPTDLERAGNLSGLATLYDQKNGYTAYTNNQLAVSTQAAALLKYYPEPNLATTSNGYNYHRLTTSQTNTTQIGARYMRSLGKNASLAGLGRGGGRRTQNQGLRQSVSLNYNWSQSSSDVVELVPELGGKSASDSNSLQATYTIGYYKLTSVTSVNWNRSNSHTRNYFTEGADVATQLGILNASGAAINSNPINYGLPNIQISSLTSLTQAQPSESIQQTLSLSQTLSWIHGKHNLRFGGDYRRVHRDFLGSSNATGTFVFTGKFTEDAAADSSTGSSLADFLLGYPQETTIAVTAAKTYLRDNVFDLYAQDDYRATSFMTLNFGLRYEYFAPYTEKNNHLAMVDTNPSASFTSQSEVQAGDAGASSGSLPASLVHGDHIAFSPRIGAALRLPYRTVLRAGYGINFTVGQYNSFASSMAIQPMGKDAGFVNEQTNIASTIGEYTLAKGFGSSDTTGNYALDPHYRLPYVQVWNLDLQKTLPWGMMLNLGYNGSYGSNLDLRIAPRASVSSPGTDPSDLAFTYEYSGAYSHFHGGTVRLNKRMTHGIAMGANYQYSHSIDDASSVGVNSTVVAQNWQNVRAEAGNSSFDQRHKVSGNYVIELPFGKDKPWFSNGVTGRILEGFMVSGSYTFATGTPLTPSYSAAVSDVAHGTSGTLRPDRDYSKSLTAGGGSSTHWFNTSVFSTPTADAYGNAFGTASRNSIPGPGTVSNNMSLSRTVQLGSTRSFEARATASNVFNTVQYSGVGTTLGQSTFGKVTSASSMRSFQFTARYRF